MNGRYGAARVKMQGGISLPARRLRTIMKDINCPAAASAEAAVNASAVCESERLHRSAKFP